ncbi:MAG: bifunctional DNA primase/polymerase [Pseudonocardiaceae bacterium]
MTRRHAENGASPSGGQHRYFLAPGDRELRNTCAGLGWRIDTRAAGGAIIAAGSVRRIEVSSSAPGSSTRPSPPRACSPRSRS